MARLKVEEEARLKAEEEAAAAAGTDRGRGEQKKRARLSQISAPLRSLAARYHAVASVPVRPVCRATPPRYHAVFN